MSITIAERNETIVERNETVVALEDVERNETVVALELEDEATDYLADQGTGHDAPAQAHPSRLGDQSTGHDAPAQAYPSRLGDQSTGHDAPAQAYPSRLGEYLRTPDPADTADRPGGGPALAVFCYENPDSFVGQYVSWVAGLV